MGSGRAITFDAVGVVRDGRTILDGIDLRVAAGELIVLVGPSGSGKSTLLKSINRLIGVTRGTVAIDGKDVMSLPLPELRRSVGYCFQAVGLFPHMTVAENIGVGLRLMGASPADVAKRVDALLERVSLPAAEFRERMPGTLSGGQAQRVAVARALATRPPVILLDEPFGALDPETRAQIQRELIAVCAEDGPTIVFVSHDLGEALTLGERIAVLHGGRLLRVADPASLMRDPGDPRIEALLEPAKASARAIVGLMESR
jgi:osmoprotectant transport system ATP-binding protein